MLKKYIPIKDRWQHYHEASILSLVGGWLNTVGFISLFGIYTNHVTGYIVAAGKEVILGGLGLWLLFISVFIFTISLTAWCELRWKKKFPRILVAFFVAETCLITLFMLSGMIFSPFESLVEFGAVLTAVLGISAMGVRNAIIRTLLSSMATSTLMTGNIAQLTIDTIVAYGSSASTDEKKLISKQNICKILPSIISFATGAIIGAIGYLFFSFSCMVIPIILMIYICYREWKFSFA